VNGYPSFSETYSSGNMLYSSNQTGLPSLQGVSLPASVGFNYASFLIGAPNSGYDSVPSRMRTGNHSMAFFFQDNWKVNRKLTLDYGLRYDFQTYLKEHSGYMFSVGATTPNPTGRAMVPEPRRITRRWVPRRTHRSDWQGSSMRKSRKLSKVQKTWKRKFVICARRLRRELRRQSSHA